MVSVKEGIKILQEVLNELNRKILSKELDPNSTNIINEIEKNLKQSSSELHQQWQNNNFDVNHLFEFEGNIKFSLLHVAAVYGHKDVVEFLLKSKADIHAKDNYGWTALHFAAFYGHKDVVAFLLEKGANLLLRNKNGKTPRDLAKNNDIKELFKKEEERMIMSVVAGCASAALSSGVSIYLFMSGIVAVGAINITLAVLAVAAVALVAGSITYKLLEPNYEVKTPNVTKVNYKQEKTV